MYVRRTIQRKKIIEVLVDNYKLFEGAGQSEQASMCSILSWELIGLRICMSCGGSEIHVYNPTSHKTELKFDSRTGREII